METMKLAADWASAIPGASASIVTIADTAARRVSWTWSDMT